MDVLESNQPSKPMTSRALNAGLLIAAVGIVLNLVLYVSGMDMEMITNPALSWANRIVSIGLSFYFIHAGLKKFRDEDRGGFLSVGQGIGFGSLAGLVSGVITAIWVFIFTTFIDTGMIDKIKEVSLQQMQEQGQSAENAEKAMEMMSMFFSPGFMAGMVVLSSVFFCFLCGLFAGLFLKKEKAYL